MQSFKDNGQNVDVKKPSRVKETHSIWSEIYEWVDCAVITVVCILLLFTFVFRQVEIEGDSMKDTLFDGNRVIVSNVFYTPKYGDVVVISSEVYNNEPIIKRIIATGGQWIDIKAGVVYVGDTKDAMQPVGDEFVGDEYTTSAVGGYTGHQYPLQVPENCVFVMGDNRRVSLDSRTTDIGFVDTRHIMGKAIFKIFPFGKIDKQEK